MLFIVILFILGAIFFVAYIAPKMTAAIANEIGIDSKKWIFYYIIFNVFAIIYLYTELKQHHHAEKRTLLIFIFIYLGIFAGAYLQQLEGEIMKKRSKIRIIILSVALAACSLLLIL